MFVDRVRVNLRAGNGGAGVVSFVRAKESPRASRRGKWRSRGLGVSQGPIPRWRHLSVISGTPTTQRVMAPMAKVTSGMANLVRLILPVPLGTARRDRRRRHDGRRPGRRGPGDRGRERWAWPGKCRIRQPLQQGPGVAEQGEYGRSEWLTLELKLLADAALIGFPNAGKSTFISKVSAAKLKIADYPFTTLVPNLGVVSFDGREFVMADIPGLIEGAASKRSRPRVPSSRRAGAGPRHPPRSVADARSIAGGAAADPEARDRRLLLRDRGTIEHRPAQQVGSRRYDDLAVALGATPVSAVSGEGIRESLHAIADLVEEAERIAPQRKGYVLHRPLGPTFTVRREEGAGASKGSPPSRAVAFADLTLPEAADMAAWRLSRLGVDQALLEAGAVEGDEVRIGEISFEFTPERAEEE